MWTSQNRGRYDRSKLRYPSDLTDDEWALVKPLVPRTAKLAVGARVIAEGSGERPRARSLDWLSVARDPERSAPGSSPRLLRSVDL